ncbi:hypothetical protein TrST_g8625 [Triparma strigata]|uniref:Deoxyuridine 5'-triphosphate nucleotidohydrolase n=1 Tax=Triparma strigata TaxID=1606541 RepID=A0A9W7F2Z6_9STRA|nr:hypothetical protein TrST_g8625 [Triparma strigata]
MKLILQTIRENWKEVLDKTCVGESHNWRVKKGSAGLDIPCPMSLTIPPGQKGFRVHLGVRVEPDHHFWLVPRSSISKKHLRMSNSVGLIDMDYRGELIMVVDNVKASAVNVLKGERLCQIVAMNGSQISFSFGKVDMNTERGEGGFGSTS